MTVAYLAWLNIISLAVNLLNTPSANEGITVKIFQENSFGINLSDSSAKVFHIDVYSNKSGNKIKGCILIPRQDIFASEDADRFLFPFVPNAVFLTVNEFAVIYEEAIQEPDLPKSKTLLPYVNKVQQILGVEQNNKPTEKHDNYTTPDGIQVIQSQVFPQYVELQVAKTGSASIDYASIKKLFPHKMILLSVIPDTGKVRQVWLSNGDTDFPPAFFKIQDQVTKQLTAFLTEDKPVTSNRIHELKQQIKEFMEQNHAFNQETYDFLDTFIDRILLWEEPKTFSGYQPKQTPDKVADFMPQLANRVNQLPVAEPDNLGELTILFKKYRKTAKKNQGRWVEGNIVLGAKPKEYQPTEDELMFGEIGSRLVTILNKVDKNEWPNLWKQQKLKNKKLAFTRFSFIHYDVMGSGRFFYVDTMKKVTVKWNRKKFEVGKEE